MQNPRSFAMQGGLDTTSIWLGADPGTLRECLNFESDFDGYRRLGGYERVDGRPRPHLASWWSLPATITAPIAAGATVTGGTSGATAVVLIAATTATTRLILEQPTDTFVNGEALTVSAAPVGTTTDTAAEQDAESEAERKAARRAARDSARARISAVPGSGPVRGVAIYRRDVYAWRDNAGATACVMHKATASGWAAVTPGHIVHFTALSDPIAEGATLTRGGATAIVRRLVRQSGSYTDDTLAGYMIVTDISGTFTAGAATAPGATLTLADIPAAITFPAGGRYTSLTHNFRGTTGTERLYAANGVGPAFEFDGTIVAPILTGAATQDEKPQFVAVHKQHLFLGYTEGAIVHSEPGEPLQYDAVQGAGEIAFGAPLSGLMATASTLLVFMADRISYLVGSGTSSFQVEPVNADSGAVRWSVQPWDSPIYFGNGAIRRLTAVDALGGWRMNGLSQRAQKFFDKLIALGNSIVASAVVRQRDTYRVFFSDGRMASCYLGRKMPEITISQLPNIPNCVTQGLLRDGDMDSILFGTTTGFVMEMDTGTSFDGAEIDAGFTLAFADLGSPRGNKRFHSCTLEVSASEPFDLRWAAEVDYGHEESAPMEERSFTVEAGGGAWNIAAWDEFLWSMPSMGSAMAEVNMVGRNISLAVMAKSDDVENFVVSAATYNITPRGVVRI